MKFLASYSANRSNTYSNSCYDFTTLSQAVKTIKEIVKGEHQQAVGNISRCSVSDENGNIVWAGSIHGTDCRVFTDKF